MAHFSNLDDIMNYCSAFQTFLEVENRRGLGKIIANKLTNSFDVPDNTKQKMKIWMEKFHEIRSYYTHGATINYEDLIYNNIRHIDIAGIVFHALIVRQYSPGLEYLIDTPVLGIFDSQENFENLIRLLTKNHAKEYILSCENHELIEIRNLLYDIDLHTNINYVDYKNKNRLKRALDTVICLCGELCKNYLRTNGKEKEFYVKPLKKIQNVLDKKENFEQKIDEFPNASIDAQESNQTLKEIKVRDIIPLSLIFESFGKILEVYRR